MIKNVVVLTIVLCLCRGVPFAPRCEPLHVYTMLLTSKTIKGVVSHIGLSCIISFFCFQLVSFPVFGITSYCIMVTYVLFVILVLFCCGSSGSFRFLGFGGEWGHAAKEVLGTCKEASFWYKCCEKGSQWVP